MAVDFDKLMSVFREALEEHPPEQWDDFVQQAAGADEELCRQARQLLHAHAHGHSLLDKPVVPSPTVDQPITEKPGTQIGPYKLLQQIGEGGMGVVYMAEQQEPVKRRVALKIIKPGMDTRQVIARFETERQALAMMDHPNIATVLDAGTTSSGRPYFVMELVNGIPINEYCDQEQLSAHERLRLFTSVCHAVQHAHQKGVIHRDIKPSNILVAIYDDQPVPKVIDFGVAKATGGRLTEKTMHTGLGQVVGTIEYMSPEQARCNQRDVDTRSDVYSLGVVLYELLTGETPFDNRRLRMAALDELLQIIREEEPARPSVKLSSSDSLSSIAANRGTDPGKLSAIVRGELDWIVMKALEKERSRRYATASQFAEDVEHYLQHEPVSACPPSAAYRIRKFAYRNRVAIGAMAAVIAALLVGIVGTAWQTYQAMQERDKAIAAEQKAKADNEKLAAIHDFVFEDLLGQASPRIATDPNVSIRTAVDLAAQRIDGRFQDQPLIKAAVCHSLGLIYNDLGEWKKASHYFETAQLIGERHLGSNHPETLKAASKRAEALGNAGQLREAAELHRRVLESRQSVLGEEHDDTYVSRSQLASILSQLGEYPAAEKLYRKILEHYRRTKGERHITSANTMMNLALVLKQAGNSLREAEQMYRQALAIQQNELGESHPYTLATMGNLASLLRRLDEPAEAKELELRTLELRRETLGDKHPHTISSIYNTGNAMLADGNFADATPLLHEAWKTWDLTLGKEHPSTLKALATLALLSAAQGDYETAERQYRTVFENNTELPDDHPFILRCKHNLGEALWRQNKQLEEAELLLREACDGLRGRLGAEHPATCTAMKVLANILEAQGRLSEEASPDRDKEPK